MFQTSGAVFVQFRAGGLVRVTPWRPWLGWLDVRASYNCGRKRQRAWILDKHGQVLSLRQRGGGSF